MECYDDYSKHLLTAGRIYDLEAEVNDDACEDVDFDDNETQTTSATSTTGFSVSLVEFSNHESNAGRWNGTCKPSAIKAEQQRQQQELQQLQLDGVVDDVNEHDVVLNHTRRHHMIGQQEWLLIRGDRRIISEEEARRLKIQFENSERLLKSGGPHTRPRILYKLDGKAGKYGRYKCRMASLAEIKKNVNTKRPTPKSPHSPKGRDSDLNKSSHSTTKKRKVAPLPTISSYGKGQKLASDQPLPKGRNSTLRTILSSYFEKLNELEQEHYQYYYQATHATTQSLASRHAQDFRKTLDAFLAVPYTDQLPETLLEFALQGYHQIIRTTMTLWDELCKLFMHTANGSSHSNLTNQKSFTDANDDDVIMDDDSNIDICIDGIICSLEDDNGSRDPGPTPATCSSGKSSPKTTLGAAIGRNQTAASSHAVVAQQVPKKMTNERHHNDTVIDIPKVAPLRVSWIAQNENVEKLAVINPLAKASGTGNGVGPVGTTVPISEMRRLDLKGDGAAAVTGIERSGLARARHSFEQNPVGSEDNATLYGRMPPDNRGIIKSHSMTEVNHSTSPCNPSPSVGFRAAVAYKISVALKNKQSSATPKAVREELLKNSDNIGSGTESNQEHPDSSGSASRTSVASRTQQKSFPTIVEHDKGGGSQTEESNSSIRKSGTTHSYLPPPPFMKSSQASIASAEKDDRTTSAADNNNDSSKMLQAWKLREQSSASKNTS